MTRKPRICNRFRRLCPFICTNGPWSVLRREASIKGRSPLHIPDGGMELRVEGTQHIGLTAESADGGGIQPIRTDHCPPPPPAHQTESDPRD